MITSAKRNLLQAIERVFEIHPEVRFGQLLDLLSVLSDDRTDRSIAELEDDELLEIVEGHLGELSSSQANVAI